MGVNLWSKWYNTLTAVCGHHTGLNVYATILQKLLCTNLYKCAVAVGNTYLIIVTMKNPQVLPLRVGHMTLLHATRPDASLFKLQIFEHDAGWSIC